MYPSSRTTKIWACYFNVALCGTMANSLIIAIEAIQQDGGSGRLPKESWRAMIMKVIKEIEALPFL